MLGKCPMSDCNFILCMNIVHYLATLAGIFAFIPSLFSTLVGFVSISAMNIYYEL